MGGRKSGQVARRAYLTGVIALGLAALAWSAVSLIVNPAGYMVVVLVALTVISAWKTVRMPGFPVSFSLSDTFTITGALLFGPATGTLLVALDGLVISGRLKSANRSMTRVLFNIAAPALAMWLASRVFFYLVTGPSLSVPNADVARLIGPLALFAALYFLLNTGLVVGAVAIGRDVSLVDAWKQHFLPLWLTFFVGTSVAGLLLLLMAAGLANLRTLVLAMPLLVALVFAFRTGIDRMRRHSIQFAELRSYAAALRSSQDAVLLTDTEGLVTFMNPMAERLTGWPESEAKGRPVRQVLQLRPPAGEDSGDVTPVLDDGSLRDYILIRRDGVESPVEEMHGDIRDEDESTGGTIWTFRDITQRIAIEAERQLLLRREQEARASADAANRSKDEFLATLSHELRTPATAIIGWTHLLKGGRLDDERSKKALAALERNAAAQAAVLDDLLDMSRMIRGAMRLDIRRTRLIDVINEAMEAVEPAVEAKELTVEIDMPPDAIVIDADPDRLRQILWNLLANAVKFTPDRGTISVKARPERETVRIDVADTGAGIDQAFLPFVFDRFRQADASPKREHGGLGLGLAIARDLVELHGGIIEAASEGLGKGARFTVWLPASVRQRRDDPEPTQGRLL